MDLLSRTELSYTAQRFKGLTHQNETIKGKVFDECKFVDCSFRETAFIDCVFLDCRFTQCDLSLVSVGGCVFTTTQFHDSQVIGVNWSEANWNKQSLLKTLDFHNCVLNYAIFIGLELKEMQLTRCIVKEADFADANLSKANCQHTDFLNSRFLNTNLSQADFSHAINYTIAPDLNQIKKAKFSLPEAMALLYGLDIVLDE